VLAASQIASALADHAGHVRAVVPHYAMSGGTLVALAADEIVMEAHAAPGPVDPQTGRFPAASIVAALDHPGDRDDETLILADVSRKALRQMEAFVYEILSANLDPLRARDVARLMTHDTWTHDPPRSQGHHGGGPGGGGPGCQAPSASCCSSTRSPAGVRLQ
jgi:ClpP class serine protease